MFSVFRKKIFKVDKTIFAVSVTFGRIAWNKNFEFKFVPLSLSSKFYSQFENTCFFFFLTTTHYFVTFKSTWGISKISILTLCRLQYAWQADRHSRITSITPPLEHTVLFILQRYFFYRVIYFECNKRGFFNSN